MRTGACTVQQSLTAEAASILRHSLSLARRRGHSQVTPLHVAATLLSSSSTTTNLLRRACLTTHPHHPPSHPLHCRALELCFNVALNRLPTNPPSSLIQPLPSLSNALIAALKRAQAHQRRGCIEQQNHHQHQHNQPLLAIKVELDQLIISILDDPSVSRVMREAGFSSTSVKNNIEEDSSFSPPSSMSDFLKPKNNELSMLLEVMTRKQSRNGNVVVVGDSATSGEGLLCELKGKVERGEVPDELKAAQFIRLNLSYVHLRLMSRGDVEMKVSDLRTKVASSTAGVIIHAGDLRWAVDDEVKGGFNPVDHIVAEVGRLVSELRNCRVWLVATASYQTYRSCLTRQPSLEAQWSLQAVVVPSISLALGLPAPSGLDSWATKLNQFPFPMLEPMALRHRDEEVKLSCCVDCTSNYQKEASVFKSEATEGPSHLPSWLQHHKDSMSELRRKWNRLCQRLHHARHDQIQLHTPFNQNRISKSHLYGSSHPWWSTSLHYNQNKAIVGPSAMSFSSNERELPMKWLSEVNLHPLQRAPSQEVKTTLALGSSLIADEQEDSLFSCPRLSQQLHENIPWQSEAIPSIVKTLHDCKSNSKGSWVLIQGNDRIAKRRLARVAANSLSGSADRLFHVNVSKSGSSIETLAETMRKEPKCVILIEDIDRADKDFTLLLQEGLEKGFLVDESGKEVSVANGVFILTSSSDSDEKSDSVLKMKLWVEESLEDSCTRECKRGSDFNSFKCEMKKPRREYKLDLNISADDEDCNGEVEDAAPTDLSQEVDSGDLGYRQGLVDAIGARLTLDANPDRMCRLSSGLLSKLQRVFEETRGSEEEIGCLCVDATAAEEMAAAAGSFLESKFERWLREVFQRCLPTVGKGGKVRLSVVGREADGSDCGFMGSLLPNRINVE